MSFDMKIIIYFLADSFLGLTALCVSIRLARGLTFR